MRKGVTHVTQRAFAAKVNATTGKISRLIREGVLPKAVDGSIPLDAGLVAWGKYQESAAAGQPEPGNPALELRLAKARADLRKREADAEAREMANRESRGELVELHAVRADALAVGEMIRAHLATIAPRVAPLVAAIEPGPRQIAEIEVLIGDEVQRALAELQRSQFAKGETT